MYYIYLGFLQEQCLCMFTCCLYEYLFWTNFDSEESVRSRTFYLLRVQQQNDSGIIGRKKKDERPPPPAYHHHHTPPRIRLPVDRCTRTLLVDIYIYIRTRANSSMHVLIVCYLWCVRACVFFGLLYVNVVDYNIESTPEY